MDLDDDMPIIVVEQPLDLINKIGITKYKDKAQPTLKIEKISEVPLRKRAKLVRWNSDGTRFGIYNSENSIKTYIVKNDGATVEEGHDIPKCRADWLSWSPRDPVILATVFSEAKGESTVDIWNVMSGECIRRIPIPASGCCVEWGTKFIAVADKNDKLHVIDTSSWAMKSIQVSEVNQIAWNPAGTLLFLANRDGSLTIFRTEKTGNVTSSVTSSLDWVDSQFQYNFEAVPSQILGFSFDRSGDKFMLVTNDSNFSVWSTNDLICLQSFTKFDVGTPAVAFCGNGMVVAACNKSVRDRSEPFRVFSAESGLMLGSTDNDTRVACFAYCYEQKVLACVPDDDKKVVVLFAFKQI